MKTLYIIRHAKSSWDNADDADFDRPLNERGKRDAPRMGKRLKERAVVPDLLLTSPARRAYSTCKRIAEVLGYREDKIKTDRALYHAGEREILGVIRDLKDKYNCVMIFGHNPGLTDFVNAIGGDSLETDIDNLPTCGVVAFTFDAETWKDVNWEQGKFLFFDFPKSKDD